jgi:predicted ATPase
MLCYLVEHPNHLVTKAELRRHVWAGVSVTDTVLRVCVQEIRAALGDSAAAPQYLETVGRQGYRLVVEEVRDLAPPLTAGPIVGRQAEIEALERWYQRASQGIRQFVLVSGEAGVGKTTLVDVWLARLDAESGVEMARGQCVEHYGEGEPYLPYLEALAQLGHSPRGQDVLAVLRRYAPMWLAQLPGLVPEAERERLQRHVQGTTPARMLRELAEAIEVLSAETPLVLVLEDLQWSDRSTVELLAYMAQRRAFARLLVLGTYRPVEVVLRAHPLRGMVQELRGRGQAVVLPLECLPAEDVAAYMAGCLGGPVAAALAGLVYERTDGNALFLVNIVEHLVQQGLVARPKGEWTLRTETAATMTSLPEGLRQLLLRRIEDLKPEARRVLEAASVLGEEFTTTAVAAGVRCPVAEVEALFEALAAQHHFIDDGGLARWPDGTIGGSYRFQHALYQQVLYEQLGTARRAQLHQRIGARLESGYGVRARDIAAHLAVHFERGGEVPRAVHYWQQAGDNAARRNAHPEAIAALRKGLELLAMPPESPEGMRQELEIQLSLGELLMAVQGMSSLEAGEAYTRAHALCQQGTEAPQVFRVLAGLFVLHGAQARLHTAEEIGQQLSDIAQRLNDPTLARQAYTLIGVVLFFRGEIVKARAYLEQSLEGSAVEHPPTCTVAGGLHCNIVSLVWLGRVLWLLGYTDQARQRCQEALALARQAGHGPSLAFARFVVAECHQLRRDVAEAYAQADALISLSREQGLVLRLEQGRILRGWALAMQGDKAEGVAQIRQGLTSHQDIGPKVGQPYRLALLAEAYGQAGQPEVGLQTLVEALTMVAETEERWWEAELHRLQGALLLQLQIPDARQVEACFQQALAVAHRQQAKSLELRAAMSLSRLWRQQGQREAARGLLAPIYGWFTEGFDTPDLQEAKALLEELAPR